MTPTQVLDIRFESSDFNAEVTIREYLKKMLGTLIIEQEGFSGKRPFGNSGWMYDIGEGLAAANAIGGGNDWKMSDVEDILTHAIDALL
jgi:hypothetical protein